MIALYFGLSLLWGNTHLSLETELEDSVLQRVQLLQSEQEVWRTLNAFSEQVFPSARLYYEQGLRWNQQGDFDVALRYYTRALELEPQYIPALYDRAELYFYQAELPLAKIDLEYLQSLDTTHWVVYYRLSQIAVSEHAVSEVERHLKRALQLGMPKQILMDDHQYWKSSIEQDAQLARKMELFLSLLGMETIWRDWMSVQ